MASSSKSASTSASTSTSTADGNTYYAFDVFLNHRGSDGKTFASHLYDRLTDHRLRVFLDREEMEKGEELTPQINGAIRASSVNIAIFSPKYCESSWCLNELLLMLECKRTKGSTILPIFFHVEPSVLRWTEGEKGVYGEVLGSLQKKRNRDGQLRYKPEIIGEWKKALHDVAEISGYELDGKSSYNGDESKLLKDVVEKVLKLVPKPPLYVSIYPTGLEEKVKDFKERLQQHESGKAKVVGIVGLGGIGKTTLAKEFYNREKEEYRRSSFLFHVRENDSRGELKKLQRQLIKELSGKDTEINSTDEGIPLLAKHLPHWHALIILDDVDDIGQLRALLPVLPAKDSFILVTSRDKSVLQIWELIEDPFIYTLEGLSLQHSVELFCRHAFHQPGPLDAAFEHLVNKFVDACGKLPLSLSVIGALLRGKNPKHWEEQLRKIRKTLPTQIQKILEISYESLDDEEKKIFLDVACFFVGEEKDTAMMIWEESGWAASLGLETLRNKHLVEVEVEAVWKKRVGSGRDEEECMVECIRMHDHLRDMGRYLADKEPSLRRIWSVTENLSDLSPVGGIRDSAERRRRVSELRWRAPTYFQGSCVEGVFNVEQPPQLILLRCYHCPDSSLAPNISTKNLRVLHIEGSNLETLWHLESQAPRELRELYIAGYRLPKIPQSIGQLRRLEKVVLRREWFITSFETLPDEFCQLQSLKYLELYVNGLKALPESFGDLSSLQHLHLYGCSCLEDLPNSFGNLTNLQHINLSYCWKLRLLPDSFWNLTNLQHINLSGCKELWELPGSFGNLTNLQHIDLSFCHQWETLPNIFGNLSCIKFLSLEGCTCLKDLPNSLGNLTNLQHINLSGCKELRELPGSFGNLTNLQHIDLSFCHQWETLPNTFGNFSCIKFLSLEGCTCLKDLPNSFGNLTNLQHINLSGCKELWELPRSFGNLTNLQHIDLSFCNQWETLPNTFGNLSCIKFLSLQGCGDFTIASEALGNITTLEHLNLQECFAELPPQLTSQRFLQELYLSSSELPEAIGNLCNLRSLFINSSQLEMLPLSFGDLRSLQELEFERCPFKRFPEPIRMLTQLDTLALRNMDLKQLKITEWFSGLPARLATLEIRGCEEMEELLGLERLESLNDLRVFSCRGLKRIHGLAQLTKLQTLHVYDNGELEELPGIEGSQSLKKVNVFMCPKLKRKLEYYVFSHRTCRYDF